MPAVVPDLERRRPPRLGERAGAGPGQPERGAAAVRRQRRRRRDQVQVPRLAAGVAVLAGTVNLGSALLPAERSRLRLLSEVIPAPVSVGATVAVAAAGIGLLLLAGGLRRRYRIAWLAAVALLASSAVLNVLKGLDVEEGLVAAFLAGLLAGQGRCFVARVEQSPIHRRLLGPALLVAAITLAYGTLGLLANDRDVRGDLGLGGMAAEVARMALGLGTATPLSGRFGRLFPNSVAAVFCVGALMVAARALAPALRERDADPRLPELVARSGDSLAYFALRDDRASVRAGDALVSYGPVGSVALACGDPLGPVERWPAAAAAFLEEAAAQGRIAAVLGCGELAAQVWRDAGLTVIYLGDEAVLELDRFTLEGRAVRIARQSWHRARRFGYGSVVSRTGDLDAAEVAALAELSRRWRGGTAERGFSMALGRLFDPRDPGTLVVAARDAAGRLRGFLHFVPWGADGASLDVMRRDRQAPSWLNDFLIVEAARRLPALGVRRLSLNFAFLRAVLAAGGEPGAPGRLRLARWGLRRLSGVFQIETLYRFNRKFDPDWQPRYLAVECVEELPRVAFAALKAEGLLLPAGPVPGRALGRRGTRAAPTRAARARPRTSSPGR
jgi:lysyl-tRNA synthetase class 2